MKKILLVVLSLVAFFCIADDIALAKENGQSEAMQIYKEGMTMFLSALVDAHNQKQDALKDEMLKILADTKSVDEVEKILEAILYPVSRDLEEIPKEIHYAIAKAIKMVPDKMGVGELLFQHLQSGDLNARLRLMKISHPVMNALICVDACKNRLPMTANFWEQFSDTEPCEMVESFMQIARAKTMYTQEEISEGLYRWMEEHPNSTDTLNLLEDYVSRFNADRRERAIAAYALGGFNDPRAIQILNKAYKEVQDESVRSYIEMAIKNKQQQERGNK